MKFIKFLGLILALYPSITLANLANLQKFRLAKAKLALANQDHQTYKKLIQLNISSKVPHIDSLVHWGDYLLQDGEYSKALRAYHQVIGRLHTKQLLDLKDNKLIETTIRSVPPPEKIVEQLYLKLAEFYLKLLGDKTFNHLHKKKFQEKAEKYFTISKLYGEQVFYSTYWLGKLELENGDKEKAYQILIKARKIPSARKDAQKLKDDIDLILAESLFYYTQQDSSQLYLRGIYQNENKNSSTRDYAKYYFDFLSKDYYGSSVSYLLSQKYNIHELTDEQRAQSDTQSFDDEYGVEDGALSQLSLQSFINKKFKNKWSALGNFNFTTEKTTQEKAKRADTRFLSVGVDLKKFTSANNLYKINYTYQAFWTRNAKGLSLSKNDSAHTFRPEYTYIKQYGAMSWGGIYSVITEDVEQKVALGLTMNYRRHNRSRWWSPTYSLAFIKQSEILERPDSTILNFSLSNPSIIDENWTLFSTFDFISNSNAQSRLNYTRYEISVSAQRQLHFIENLYLDIDFRNSSKSYGDGSQISIMKLGAGCTYNF